MKKQLKGFTLIEIIISFAIFTILAAYVGTAVATACRGVEDIEQMNQKVDKQAMASTSANLADAAVKDDKQIGAITTIKIGGSGTGLSGSPVNIKVEYREKDKIKIGLAKAKSVTNPTGLTDDEKKDIRDESVPNLKYVKLP